ncbi:MAG: hypothetical protein M5U19_12470 [Microthrixaceae bacterium]|nr:hypothetical protein [Microthrixaceae bacterium]
MRSTRARNSSWSSLPDTSTIVVIVERNMGSFSMLHMRASLSLMRAA